MWLLARFQLTRRVARSLGDSGASCLHFASLFISLPQVQNRDFKFGTQVGLSKSQPANEKLSMKGQGHVCDPLKKFTPPEISLEQLKLETSNFVHDLAM